MVQRFSTDYSINDCSVRMDVGRVASASGTRLRLRIAPVLNAVAAHHIHEQSHLVGRGYRYTKIMGCHMLAWRVFNAELLKELG